jgi:hypothetical protein
MRLLKHTPAANPVSSTYCTSQAMYFEFIGRYCHATQETPNASFSRRHGHEALRCAEKGAGHGCRLQAVLDARGTGSKHDRHSVRKRHERSGLGERSEWRGPARSHT